MTAAGAPLHVKSLADYKGQVVVLNLWATKDVSASASGGNPGPNRATIPKGYKVFANLNFRF